LAKDPVNFSSEEADILKEREFFYARKALKDKLRRLFEGLREALLPHMEDSSRWVAPQGLDSRFGHLASGEYYQDLPYVYLDFPKHFSKQEIFAFRWMAWWGHHFFFAFISQGPCMETHRERLLQGWDQYCQAGLFLGLSEDLWDWRAEPGLVSPVVPATKEAASRLLGKHPFLKLLRVIAFDDPAVLGGQIIEEAVGFFLHLEPLFAPLGA
jgi:hypothetical protein